MKLQIEAGNDLSNCYAKIERKLPEINFHRKNSSCPVLLSALFLFLLSAIIILSSKISVELQQKDNQIQDLQKKVFQLDNILKRKPSDTKESRFMADEKKRNEVNLKSERNKRSATQRSRKNFCHLEGKEGLNIVREGSIIRQRPRHDKECFLWKHPDNEQPASCPMMTGEDGGSNGIQFIVIDKTGYYYVYSQISYQADLWTDTGHHVELISRSRQVTILKAIAPKKDVGSPNQLTQPTEETQYTGGVFLLSKYDKLAVYPLRGMQRFIMNGEQSFFGIFQLRNS